jgi:hypothetical protein
MFVKPAPGRTVPDPERGGVLPVDGRDVPVTTYWLRRIEDNDVLAEERRDVVVTGETTTHLQPLQPEA